MAAEPGWFPDPDRPNEWRYWTGSAWAPRQPGAGSGTPSVRVVEAAEKSTDAYAWSLALLPLFGIVVSWFAWDGTAESADAINGILPWVTIALSLGFAFLDERTLRPLADRPSPAWVFLTPCAYLLVRVLRVPRSNPAPLIVSVAFVAIWITVSVAQAGNVI